MEISRMLFTVRSIPSTTVRFFFFHFLLFKFFMIFLIDYIALYFIGSSQIFDGSDHELGDTHVPGRNEVLGFLFANYLYKLVLIIPIRQQGICSS